VALLRGEVRVTAVMGRERRRPERVDGGGVYEPWGGLGASLDRHGSDFSGGLQDIISSRGSPEAGDRTWSRAQDCLLRPSQRCLGSR
jgi:hypothetical protein